MFWQLPASVRVLAAAACHRSAVRAYSVTAGPAARLNDQRPLRILFCGSDEFSIASLRALNEAKNEDPGLIGSIEVVHRPAKPTGRGHKTLREVPIASVASSLSLPTHQLDTFTGWTPPSPISLIIAVSFGLLIPQQILSLASRGGLNLHPSLLPDLRGAAPIEHAILKGRKYTGVSVQTLHPHKFDWGTVLAQSPLPGIRIPPDATTHELTKVLAARGASMLVDVVKSGQYKSLNNTGALSDELIRYATPHGGFYDGPVTHAARLSPRDREIDFGKHTLEHVLRVQRALGDPWCTTRDGERLILHKVAEGKRVGLDESVQAPKGLYAQKCINYPLFKMADGKSGVVLESTFAGGKKGMGNAKLLPKLREMA